MEKWVFPLSKYILIGDFAMYMCKEEMETIITFDRSDDKAEIYTADPIMIRKLAKLENSCPNEYVKVKETAESVTYAFPKKLFSLRKPIQSKELSPERKAELSARMKELRRKK